MLRISESELSGVALTDTLSMLDDRFQLTLGVRRQDIESRNYNAAGSVSSKYNESATTPLVGVVVKPWEDVSLYYNYVEGLSKGDIAPGTAANAGETFAPYESKQHELGVKYEHGTFMTTLALFQIEKPSGEIGAGNVFSVQAEQRNRGIELSMFGEVAPGTRLMGGVTGARRRIDRFGDSRQPWQQTGRCARRAGRTAWAKWDTPWLEGFTFTGGAIYTDSQYVNQANTQELDAWTRFDAGARYATKSKAGRRLSAPRCRTFSIVSTGRALLRMARFRQVIRGPCNCPRRSTSDAQGQAQSGACCLPCFICEQEYSHAGQPWIHLC